MFVRPYTRLSVSYIRVNSGVLVFPRRIAPFFLRRDRTVASFPGTKSLRPRVPPAETTPAESKESFSVMGTPCRGPKSSPLASARSARAASDSAVSAQTWTTAFSFGFTSLIRRKNASVTSTDDTSPARISSANPRTDISGISFMLSPFEKTVFLLQCAPCFHLVFFRSAQQPYSIMFSWSAERAYGGSRSCVIDPESMYNKNSRRIEKDHIVGVLPWHVFPPVTSKNYTTG
ncbi:hypothetical protein SDC9_96346 [bioreactor metagenome]|uniref:Uncharacterized protein n=1 Tax=bioreactor metagenome TaxID=1076179 RepID=A0A645A9N8_9ZZZZ